MYWIQVRSGVNPQWNWKPLGVVEPIVEVAVLLLIHNGIESLFQISYLSTRLIS